MICYVYKSALKQDHYLYVGDKIEDGKDSDIPEALLNLLGELTLIVDFDLHAERKLPQADARQVLADLESKGFYLQMPKQDMQALEDQWFN